MLSNSFLCKEALFFRNLELHFPLLVDYISISGIIFQSIFQILMFPLIFFSLGKRFVKIWGFLFFTISLFLLSLSYLPHLELILWSILFCPWVLPKEKIKILYDDKCNLCKKALSVLKSINFNSIYEFSSITKSRELYEYYNLTEVEVKVYMVGFLEGKVYKGYDLYMKIIQINPILFVLYPLFWIGKIIKIGPLVYKAIALRRYKMMGQCELSFDEDSKQINSTIVESDTILQNTVILFYFTTLLLFILFNSSFLSVLGMKKENADSLKYKNSLFSKRIGIEAPQVFNSIDLSMGDNFMTIKKLQDNQWKLIPVIGLNGERLNYLNYDIMLFSNHNSDKYYFGQTLKYRRSLIKEIDNIITFHEQGFGMEHIAFLINNDYLIAKEKGNVSYKVEVFTSNSSKVKSFEFDEKRHNLKKVYNRILVYNGKTYLNDRI